MPSLLMEGVDGSPRFVGVRNSIPSTPIRYFALRLIRVR